MFDILLWVKLLEKLYIESVDRIKNSQEIPTSLNFSSHFYAIK